VIATNLAEQACSFEPSRGRCLFTSRADALDGARLAGRSTVAFFES
jgi:hypothetical protein